MIRILRSTPALDAEGRFLFPPVESSSREGIVCAGGNLSPGIILSAYRQGIFPWYSDEDPLLWWSPDPRFVVLPETLHVPSRAKRLLRQHGFSLSLDRDFPSVIRACARIRRPGQRGTWIVDDMIDAYTRLHSLGFAHSVEVMREGGLVGGLYGLSLGNAFFGESMFSAESGASKAGFIALALMLFEEGFTLIDSQVHTDYLASMGGVELPRKEYLKRLARALEAEDRRGDWGQVFPGFPASGALEALVQPGWLSVGSSPSAGKLPDGSSSDVSPSGAGSSAGHGNFSRNRVE
jgi:leucyl/phenylalanyl-tRNA--protein transferase